MNYEKYLGTDLFKPEKFLLFYLIFILITIASFFSGLPIKKPSLLSFAVIFLTFPFFLLGIKLGTRLYGKKIPRAGVFLFIGSFSVFYALVFATFYKFNFYLALGLCGGLFVFLYLAFLRKSEEFFSFGKVPAIFITVGTIFLLVAFYQEKGIPLLNSALRVNFLYNTAFGTAMLLFTLGFSFLMPQIKDNKKFFIILVLATALFVLSTLRGSILAVFLTGSFIAYYAKKLDNKKILVALLAALFIILFIGYLARPILNPGSLLLYRAGTTHVVFDNIVQKSMPFGYTHGELFLNGNPRDFVGAEIMGKPGANLTYTILGAPMLDFGLAGVIIWMFLLGAILQLAYLSMKEKIVMGFYPLLFAVSLIFIEIGIDPFFLLYFFIFLISYLARLQD